MRALLLSCLIVLSAGAAAGAADQPCAGLSPGPTATVSHIIDGETLRLSDGRELRLAGIIAPRPDDAGAAPGKWPSAVAARAELEALALGREVAILFGGAREDRYGRHVGHGVIAAPAGGAQTWLAGHLVQQGLVRVMTSAQNRACASELLALEREARASRLGLWAEAAYQVREAREGDALAALRGTFQIVEGEIAKAETGRGVLRLELAGPRARPLRASVPVSRAGPGQLPDGTALTGKWARIRGFLEERGGAPFLDLAVTGDLELVEAPRLQRGGP
ncbi:MAG: thermonuclease family protein [Hyphomicrobiaceae bacterium]|nr:thermonuclease family protein [Hyphomicrobiaceae bacterium]